METVNWRCPLLFNRLSDIVRPLFHRKALFSDSPLSCGTPWWPLNWYLLVTFLPQDNIGLHFEFFHPVFWGVVIDKSCFSRRKCNCGRLCLTAWLFEGVQWEPRRPVLQLSLIAPPRHCLPSLRHVSYPAQQSSLTAGNPTIVSAVQDSRIMPSIAASV